MTLKLTDAARAFFDASPALHEKDVTWKEFKAAFVDRFKDTRSDQYHFIALQSAKQRPDETISEFADRINNLGRNIIPQLDDPNAQKHVNILANKMLIAAFTTGLFGSPGEHARIALPTKMEDAVKIAVTVAQAKTTSKQAATDIKQPETFLVENEKEEKRETARPKTTREDRGARRPRSRDNNSERFQEKWEDSELTCFDCGGKGHRSRNCATGKARREARDRSKGKNYDKRVSFQNRGKGKREKSREKRSGN
jgi:hypothetical protein